MRRILIALFACLLLVGCGNKTTNVDLGASNSEQVEKKDTEENEKQEDVKGEKILDKDVDIVFSAVITGEETIEKYVENLQAENSDKIYSIYDENHYVQTIKESERKEFLNAVDEELEKSFYDIFNSEETKDVFENVEYDALLENITFYANKEAFKENEFVSTFSAVITSSVFADVVQAYNLIEPDNRKCKILIVDKETEEVLYNSEESNNTTENVEEEKSVEDMIQEINNWYVSEVWNNFVDFDSYRKTGKDCTGSEIDIDFAYEKFKKSYEKKNEYDSYINELSDEYIEFKETWNKMSEQIDIVYKDLEDNGIENGEESLSLDYLRQYSDYFWDLVYDY